MELKFQVHAKIRKPVADVFAAVADPHKLSRYFTTGGASGPLVEGATVTWDFHDYPGAFPVHVRRVVKNERIVLEWQATERDYDTRVEMEFEALDEGSTLVRITESGWKDPERDLRNSYMNCMGWTQMLCCLKCYVELGVNLREFFY
jgi:uncharacterized protein YndB with AHSA1/START domain